LQIVNTKRANNSGGVSIAELPANEPCSIKGGRGESNRRLGSDIRNEHQQMRRSWEQPKGVFPPAR
jgi:hypothetical protein